MNKNVKSSGLWQEATNRYCIKGSKARKAWNQWKRFSLHLLLMNISITDYKTFFSFCYRLNQTHMSYTLCHSRGPPSLFMCFSDMEMI